MNRTKWVMMAMGTIFVLSGCATMGKNPHLSADQTAQAFFDYLQRSDNSGAYNLLGKGLSQRVSYDQFNEFMKTIREQWGRIETEETALIPFHRRVGEADFIPLNVAPQQIKRYVFDVKFEVAQMNFDLTVAPDGGANKIIWFSVWGSSIYVNSKIQEKINNLFSNPDNSGQ